MRPKGEASFNALFRTYINSAKQRKFALALSREQFRTITSGNCHYCGIAPFAIMSGRRGTVYNGAYVYNGIDRVNSQEGYVFENCVPCCKPCNKMKSNMDKEAFLKQVSKIAGHYNVLKGP